MTTDILSKIQAGRDAFTQQAQLLTKQVKESGLPTNLQSPFLGLIDSAVGLRAYCDPVQYLADGLSILYKNSHNFINRQASKLLQTAVLIPVGASLIFLSDFKKTSDKPAEEKPLWKNPRLIAKIAGYAILAFATVSTIKNYIDGRIFLTESLSRAQGCLATAQSLMPHQ